MAYQSLPWDSSIQTKESLSSSAEVEKLGHVGLWLVVILPPCRESMPANEDQQDLEMELEDQQDLMQLEPLDPTMPEATLCFSPHSHELIHFFWLNATRLQAMETGPWAALPTILSPASTTARQKEALGTLTKWRHVSLQG